jgi:hypothetical protein
MHTVPTTPPSPGLRASSALAARTLAWTLLFAGWLVLGALGIRHAPAAAGSLAPVALWLLTLGLASRASASWSPSAGVLRLWLCGSATLTALSLAALAQGLPQALWLAASAWGLLLVAASRVVRGWRRQPGPRLPSPVRPAGLGAFAAWALAGDPAATAVQPGLAGVTVLAIGCALAWQVPPVVDDRRGAPGCRSGLFDCALAWPALAQWRDPAYWPWLAASVAMLPMMASLPLMAEGCARAGWPAHAVTGAHLLAMLAPAVVVAASRSTALARRLPGLVALALTAGGAAALAVPGVAGLTMAMALQAAAWGMAWAGTMTPTVPASLRAAAAHGGPGASALTSAATVTVLGVLAAGDGLAAWSGIHVGLGMVAALGYVAARHPPAPVLEDKQR